MTRWPLAKAPAPMASVNASAATSMARRRHQSTIATAAFVSMAYGALNLGFPISDQQQADEHEARRPDVAGHHVARAVEAQLQPARPCGGDTEDGKRRMRELDQQ